MLGSRVKQFSTTDNSTVVCVRHHCPTSSAIILVLEKIKCNSSMLDRSSVETRQTTVIQLNW